MVVWTLRQQCLEQWRQRGFGVGSSSEAGVCDRGNSGVRLVLTATGEGTSLDTSVSCSCGYNSPLLTFNTHFC
ncbi:hypothetical protein Bca4012_040960 [Brassica carinata]|uniref:(rape) hypothetical protein n=1 Tax=Brassica napus TaxID=3708 RepID=A0A816IRW6_BRANA|nr:unnamed protein product [Brassica napus]